jgi:phage-related baseplate assembly protein
MAPYAWSCAGSRQSYRYHAMSAHPDVADAAPASPTGGVARIAVLSASGDGTPSGAVLAAVLSALSDDEVRPLCDTVIVAPATVTHYSVEARIYLDQGPSEEPVYNAVRAAVTTYAHPRRRLGRKAALSGFYAALHQAGVARAELVAPEADIPCAKDEALYCENINIVIGERDV